MKPESWQQLDQLFHSALEREPEGRAAFLDEACADDDSLRERVDALLSAHAAAGSFIESPAMEVEARSVAGDQVGLAAGQAIGHYRIVSQLGVGGMGEVYLAEDTTLGRKVALKLLPAEFTHDTDRMRRFQQEARAASALNHPNIVTIHEIGQVDDRRFIATEFIDGETLRQYITRVQTHNTGEGSGNLEKRQHLLEALDIAIQTADALAVAHEAGIVHRDIKPENIMARRRDGYIKVLDFGLAKLTEGVAAEVDTEGTTRAQIKTSAGLVMGTVTYMSPEQTRGEKVDVRTDIWSLGAVLYEMVAGCAPFERPTPSEVIALILEREPPPLTRYVRDVPVELERIVNKALTKDREQRYQTAKDLLVDLRRLRRQLEVKAEVERLAPSVAGFEVAVTTNGTRAAVATMDEAVAGAQVEIVRPMSSAEYIVTEIQKHKKGFVLTALFVLAATLVVVGLSSYSRRSQPLTEKDTILLADFDNTTGDEVFDGALKQALAMQLEQSPFLNIFPAERVQQTLQSMRRSADVRVTRDVAREICERQGLKAMIVGSIVMLGNQYVITLEAVNARTSEVLAREQEEAVNKEQVLSALRQAATGLRQKLGESLGTIQKFDAPIEAMTSSLEALKAYSEGSALHVQGKEPEAIPHLKNAVTLDPQFAMAYGVLAATFGSAGDTKASREYFTKAFALRDRASERERLWIMAQYHSNVSRDLESAIEAAELLKQIYPRYPPSRFLLGFLYGQLGQDEKAVEGSQEAVRLDPNWAAPYQSLAIWLRRVGRLAEAREVLDQASAKKSETPWSHFDRYQIAFLMEDTGEMQRQMEWFRAKPDAPLFFELQVVAAEVTGQHRKAREFRAQLLELLKRLNLKGGNPVNGTSDAQTDAFYGYCAIARREVGDDLTIGRGPGSLNRGALALALCGELAQAQALADEYAKLLPNGTLANAIDLPAIRAAIANHRGNFAQAVELLQPARRYERADTTFFAHYIRGQAFLGQRSGAEAAAEFQFILGLRGVQPFSPVHPLAQLGLARAIAIQGDNEKARQAYDDFFVLWKDADSDLPILINARTEYKKLK